MKPQDIFGKRILLSPLNWGFGHVSRCIPLIQQFIEQNNQIIIACNDVQKSIFLVYFKDRVTFIHHEGYPFSFNGKGTFTNDLFKSRSELFIRYKIELKEVEELIDLNKIDLLISDHRYGFRSNKCISIFLTHQLNLPLKWYQWPIQVYHRKLVSLFDFQWCVDDEKIRLAGKLSSVNYYENAIYVGLLSRFKGLDVFPKKMYKGVLIISGPDEYAEKLIMHNFRFLKSEEIDLIIGARKHLKLLDSFGYAHLFQDSENWKKVDCLILESRKIFGYCGYTTLMDLEFLNCERSLIPCKGQFEQIYLHKKSPDFNSGL